MYTNFDINDKDKYTYMFNYWQKIVSVGLSVARIIAKSNLHRSLMFYSLLNICITKYNLLWNEFEPDNGTNTVIHTTKYIK